MSVEEHTGASEGGGGRGCRRAWLGRLQERYPEGAPLQLDVLQPQCCRRCALAVELDKRNSFTNICSAVAHLWSETNAGYQVHQHAIRTELWGKALRSDALPCSRRGTGAWQLCAYHAHSRHSILELWIQSAIAEQPHQLLILFARVLGISGCYHWRQWKEVIDDVMWLQQKGGPAMPLLLLTDDPSIAGSITSAPAPALLCFSMS